MKQQILCNDTIQITYLENMTARIKGGTLFPGSQFYFRLLIEYVN